MIPDVVPPQLGNNEHQIPPAGVTSVFPPAPSLHGGEGSSWVLPASPRKLARRSPNEHRIGGCELRIRKNALWGDSLPWHGVG